jgi:adenine-specific DNA-methyltransferase
MAEEFKPQYTFTDDRLNELKQLFPEAWEDGVFNVDTLKTLIGEYSTDNNIKEHFGLNWVGKQDARKIAAKPPTGTLKPCPGEGVNEDNTENIFIEGENLEVLKILRKSYMGKIKMIYIDPPYNTGNDFIYNDSFADSTEDYLRKTGDKSDEGLLVSNPKSSGKYHANWLSFMYPRLRLAKDLLKEDGVIFISIDENENENLLKCCDEIFGEENFVGSFPVIMNLKGNQDAFGFAETHEYIVVYTKQKINFNFGQLDIDEETIFNEWLTDEWGLYKEADNLRATGVNAPREKRPNLWYPIFLNENSKEFYVTDDNIPKSNEDIQVYPINPEGKELSWYWGKNKFNSRRHNLILKETVNGYQFYKKQRPQLGEIPTKKPKSVLYSSRYSTSTSTTHLKNLFGAKIFQAPKPVPFLVDLILLAIPDNSNSDSETVLDFFAGSGSFGHAVHEFNYFKNKNHKYILVQLPENIGENEVAYTKGYTTISEISKDRLRKTIKNIDKSKGFKVFKQEKSTIYKWQDFIPQQDGIIPDLFSKLELAFKNPLLDGTQTQDFITEVILQEGFPLTAKQEEAISGVFKITHEWVPFNLYVSMLQSFKNIDLDQLHLKESDHFICLDKAFESNDALKQAIDNQCKLFTI